MKLFKYLIEKEIERRWLIDPKRLKEYGFTEIGNPTLHILQYYASPRTRYRYVLNTGVLTKTTKIGKGVARIEITSISKRKWLDIICGRRILYKERRYVFAGDKIAELNYYPDLDLYMLEIEFKNAMDAKKFKPLGWFGKEVTNDKEYSNYALSQKYKN